MLKDKRIIKFRAWQRHKGNDDNGWFTYYRIDQERLPEVTFISSSIDACQPKRNFVSEDEEQMDYDIQEFTGLKDKNGKEIYEGDIVRISDDLIEEIKWIDETNWMGEKCPVNGWVNHASIYKVRPEVIGNVFETPELLIPPTRI